MVLHGTACVLLHACMVLHVLLHVLHEPSMQGGTARNTAGYCYSVLLFGLVMSHIENVIMQFACMLLQYSAWLLQYPACMHGSCSILHGSCNTLHA